MATLTNTDKVKSSKIGLKNLYFAEFDPATNRWTAPVPVKWVKSMNVKVNQTSGSEYADDHMVEVFDSFDNFEVDISFADLTPEEQAFFLGRDSIGAIRLSGSDDAPPWVAFMGERTKADGTKRLFKYFKGKARQGDEAASTKGGSVTTQPDSLTIVFGPLDESFPIPAYRNKALAVVDESDPEYDGEALVWYTDVIAGQTVV